jgi:hypothetical protein
MNRFRALALLLLLGLLASSPAAAIHMKYLDIVVDRGGDATVTFEDTLPWMEQGFAFLGLVNPDRDLGQVLAAATRGQVARLSTSAGVTTFSVRGFANVTGGPGASTYYTHALNLSWAQAGYESSVLAPLLDPDFSPDVTVIRFPDAYSLTFHDRILIPGVIHIF